MFETECPKCLGVGSIKGLQFKSMKHETTMCNKCKGKKMVYYKQSAKTRARKRKNLAAYEKRMNPPTPVRWVPPEKTQSDYDYDF
tara:strand:+ start:572 stop:826 length:255 start_codon:yes stop_codon:yes gene_type:complete